MAAQMELEDIWREIALPPASCEAQTTKESVKTKTESGNFFLFPCCLEY